MNRCLKAILAADVAGYSAMMGADQEGALTALRQFRSKVFGPAVVGHRGKLVKAMGDGWLVEFATAVEAVTCAIQVQNELAGQERIRLRIGIHLGDIVHEDDDIFGDGVNIAARLEELAEPGTVVISDAVHGSLDGTLRPSFEDRGAQRLKNIDRRLRVWRWADPNTLNDIIDRQSIGDCLTSHAAPPNNIPAQLSSFVGRSSELREICRSLSEARLLTLTGAGGCGKTRLACQLGAEVLEDFSDGVWFVALASLRDPALLLQAVTSVLGVREQPGRPLSETIQSHLAQKSALLILDNCEHFIRECTELVELLLLSCPGIKVVSTSREALGITGEHVHLVSGLGVPAREKKHTFEALTQFEAVQLFAERARQRNRTFTLTEANADIVAKICTRLDGIPLAIELAAARTRVLSVHQIAERLDDAFRLLGDAHRAGVSHHQTLRMAMDWSYSLLSDEEASLFRRLSVFAGSFSLDAVAAICADEQVPEFELLDLLQQLVEKSTVVAKDHGTETRYWLLETLRQYGHEKLDRGTELPEVRDRHIRYYLTLAEAAEPNIQGSGSNKAQAEWLDRLEADHDNLRIAMEYGKSEGREAFGIALAGVLWRFWEVRGHLSEGREAVRAALEIGGNIPVAGRAKALAGEGRLAWRQGDFHHARACFDKSLDLWRTAGDADGEANSLHGLARASLNLGDLSTARKSALASLEIHREIGNEQGVASAINTLGEVARTEGDFEAAEVQYREALAIFRRVGDTAASVSLLHNLGYTALNRSKIEESEAIFREALDIARDLNDRLGIFSMLGGLACVAAAVGRAERAVELFGAADSAGKDWGYAGDRIDQNEIKRWLLSARSAIGDDASRLAWERGRDMEPDEAISRALE